MNNEREPKCQVQGCESEATDGWLVDLSDITGQSFKVCIMCAVAALAEIGDLADVL